MDEIERRGPRDDTVETVFTSAFRVMIAEGAHALTPYRLHQETGIARTTIYRHWPEPADLIAAMLAKATAEHDIAEFTGDLHHDLDAAVTSLVFRFNHRPVRPLFGALVEHGRQDSEKADIAAEYIEGLHQSVRRAIAQGIERGDLVGDIDDLTTELTAPLLVRHILLNQPVGDTDTKQAVDSFLDNHAI